MPRRPLGEAPSMVHNGAFEMAARMEMDVLQTTGGADPYASMVAERQAYDGGVGRALTLNTPHGDVDRAGDHEDAHTGHRGHSQRVPAPAVVQNNTTAACATPGAGVVDQLATPVTHNCEVDSFANVVRACARPRQRLLCVCFASGCLYAGVHALF